MILEYYYLNCHYQKKKKLKPGYFSFNVEGGRCPECKGEGTVTIPMQFMADVILPCEACGGTRYKEEALEIKYREMNIDDILNMTIEDTVDFFSKDSNQLSQKIANRLQSLIKVGLGYLKLGQSSITLSGGESQRITLATSLGSPLVGLHH